MSLAQLLRVRLLPPITINNKHYLALQRAHKNRERLPKKKIKWRNHKAPALSPPMALMRACYPMYIDTCSLQRILLAWAFVVCGWRIFAINKHEGLRDCVLAT